MIDSEATIDSLVAALRRQILDVFPTSNVPDREQLGRDPMDPIAGRYLEEELDRRIDQELARLAYDPSDWVSGERREFVDRAHRTLRTTIAAAVAFPASRWEDLVMQAATTACGFVMKPVSTLVTEVFKLGAETVSSDVARSRLRGLAGHPVLTERADAWLASADQPVQRADFRAAVRSFVDEGLAREESWIGIAEPLFALHQRVNGQRVVPTARLVALYKDFGLDAVAERIVELARNAPASLWNEGMLSHALTVRSEPDPEDALVDYDDSSEPEMPALFFDDVDDDEVADDDLFGVTEPTPSHAPVDSPVRDQMETVEPEAVSERPAVVPAADSPESNGGGTDDGDASAAESEDEDSAVPLWMRFQSKINAPMTPRNASSPDSRTSESRSRSRAAAATQTVEKSAKPLWERYRKPESRVEISTESAEDFQDVEQFVLGALDTAQRQAYIETLFNGRAAEYREMVYNLGDIDTWPEATVAIADEVFRRNRVNIYSEVAIEFTNAVERRYKR